MKVSRIENIFTIRNKEEVSYSDYTFWHCLENDYKYSDLIYQLHTTLLKRI